ncbi:hypothetical protein PILCRDRAFT_815366 [Piloderma croceum F 1598]|uniref:Uncharacterized protein n=1 Tax=Piloderma croceum (strain F 1598) TaxID=765440 RepID=A0A0C3FS61_PILCF|nr:hypothetical protein PILCRDRAFT_815366 [Piloderma croceum F 1598]
MASAPSTSLDYAHPPRTIIRMPSSGTPCSKPKSFKNSIPNRNVTTSPNDEALGAFNAKSAKSNHHALVGDLDEEDEDFVSPNN